MFRSVRSAIHATPLRALLLLAFAVGLGSDCARAETNLVSNPGFEQPAKADGLPGGGWWFYQGAGDTTAALDRTVGHTGNASAKMHAATQGKSVLVSAPFAVAPGDELRFSAWVRAENLPPNQHQAFAGFAFRRADGGVFKRAYSVTESLGTNWALISGTAEAPEGAATAEIHLGYTNTPATLWFDDVAAAITSPVSFSLAEAPKPWPGEQEIAVQVVNRQAAPFHGSIRSVVAKHEQTLPVTVAPQVSRPIKVPVKLATVGAHSYRISLLDPAGKPVRVLTGRFQTRAPLVLYPACPCYHAVGVGDGDTRIDARINLNPARRAGLTLSVFLTDSAGKPLQAVTADASHRDLVGANVRVPIQAAGTFTVTARLLGPAAAVLGEATTDVRVAPRSESVVTTGPDGFLRVDGKPHFPIGLYSAARYEDLAKAGFTAVHSYGVTTGDASEAINPNEPEVQRLLDKAWANGMRMMIELPRKPIEQAKWDSVRRRILTFRYHPGLLCWGSEERVARGEAPLSHIATLYRLVHELDPDHPFVLGDTKDVIQKFKADRRDFFPDPYMDAGIWWWYPIPLKEPDASGLDGRERLAGLLQPPSWLTTTLSHKPLWIAIQSYQHPAKDARFPTPAEYRCMAFLSIINGVKALWFYTGSGQRDYYGKPAGLLNKPEEAHWDYVQKLVQELRDISPVIMAPTAAAKLTISPAGAPVEFALRERDGNLYLFAANKSDRPQTVQFSAPALAGRRARVLHENHSAALEGDTLSDTFTPFGTRLYELTPP